MRKGGMLALGFLLALSVASPAHAASAQTHHYVANDFASFPLAGFSQRTGMAVDGTVLFKATASHAVVTLADKVAKGTLPLVIETADGRRVQCVRNGRATRIDGLVAGEWAGLTVLDATYHGPCSAGATLGVMTINA